MLLIILISAISSFATYNSAKHLAKNSGITAKRLGIKQGCYGWIVGFADVCKALANFVNYYTWQDNIIYEIKAIGSE